MKGSGRHLHLIAPCSALRERAPYDIPPLPEEPASEPTLIVPINPALHSTALFFFFEGYSSIALFRTRDDCPDLRVCLSNAPIMGNSRTVKELEDNWIAAREDDNARCLVTT
jgi:hypothetical protein